MNHNPGVPPGLVLVGVLLGLEVFEMSKIGEGQSFEDWKKEVDLMTKLVGAGYRRDSATGVSWDSPIDAKWLTGLLDISGAKNLHKFMVFVFEHSGDLQRIDFCMDAIRRSAIVFGDEAAQAVDGLLEEIESELMVADQDASQGGDQSD